MKRVAASAAPAPARVRGCAVVDGVVSCMLRSRSTNDDPRAEGGRWSVVPEESGRLDEREPMRTRLNMLRDTEFRTSVVPATIASA